MNTQRQTNTQPINMAFDSKDNKGLLWKTLSENGLFNGIDSSRFTEVQHSFEGTIMNVLNKTQGNTQISLQEQNKIFISDMITTLKQFKNNEIYTAQDIKNQRKTEFEQDLERKQRDFQEMMKKNIPQDVDLSDKSYAQQYEEKLENIDALLEQQQKEREKDLFSQNENLNENQNQNQNQNQNTMNINSLEQIHASNINTEIIVSLFSQLSKKMDLILKDNEEIKELIRIRKNKKTEKK